MYQHIARQSVLAIIRKHFKTNPSETDVAKIPTGKFNTSFFVTTPERELVVRIAPPENIGYIFYEVNMMAQEPDLYRLLREKTTIPVPEILVYDTDRDIVNSDFLILERCPGAPATDVDLSGREWNNTLKQVGQYLRQAHELTTGRFGYLGKHRPMQPQRTWADAFEIMWRKMVRQITTAGFYSQQENQALCWLFDQNRSIFEHTQKSRLLHMDVWAQNILVMPNGRVTGLIDWDRALWGDPEIEFAVLDYCGISRPAFWNGYGARRPASVEAKTRQVFYYLYEIQKYIIIRGSRGKDPQKANAYKNASLNIVRENFTFPHSMPI